MKAKESLDLISYRLERSRESLRAAEIMFENSMLAFSMNRIYYAMFYAVQALLVARKVSFSKHGQVKAYFNSISCFFMQELRTKSLIGLCPYLKRIDFYFSAVLHVKRV
jgi:uncharacterized protein (UPF0332 family)